MRYRVLIEQDEDGVYVAEVPALPGCISQGRTRAEAVNNVKEAIAAYLESLKAHGEPVPRSRLAVVEFALLGPRGRVSGQLGQWFDLRREPVHGAFDRQTVTPKVMHACMTYMTDWKSSGGTRVAPGATSTKNRSCVRGS